MRASGLLGVFGDAIPVTGLSPEPLNEQTNSSGSDPSPERHAEQEQWEITMHSHSFRMISVPTQSLLHWNGSLHNKVNQDVGFFLAQSFSHAFRAFVTLYRSIWSTLLHCLQKEKHWIKGNISTEETPSYIVSKADFAPLLSLQTHSWRTSQLSPIRGSCCLIFGYKTKVICWCLFFYHGPLYNHLLHLHTF